MGSARGRRKRRSRRARHDRETLLSAVLAGLYRRRAGHAIRFAIWAVEAPRARIRPCLRIGAERSSWARRVVVLDRRRAEPGHVRLLWRRRGLRLPPRAVLNPEAASGVGREILAASERRRDELSRLCLHRRFRQTATRRQSRTHRGIFAFRVSLSGGAELAPGRIRQARGTMATALGRPLARKCWGGALRSSSPCDHVSDSPAFQALGRILSKRP
jgi:hypothetical protein